MTLVVLLCARRFLVRRSLVHRQYHRRVFPSRGAPVGNGANGRRPGPNDPLPHWRLGNLAQKEFPPDQIPLVVSEYEKAVSLSPHDYRLWMEFGSALEQEGDFDKAEKALREAVKLAPSYSYPRWFLGNLLVRTDRYDEGFDELRFAAESNGQFHAAIQPCLATEQVRLRRDEGCGRQQPGNARGICEIPGRPESHR